MLACCCLSAMQMLSLETLISVKFGRGLYERPWPQPVVVSWVVVVLSFVALLAVWQWRAKAAPSGNHLHGKASVVSEKAL
jgi:hypothetical protein